VREPASGSTFPWSKLARRYEVKPKGMILIVHDEVFIYESVQRMTPEAVLRKAPPAGMGRLADLSREGEGMSKGV